MTNYDHFSKISLHALHHLPCTATTNKYTDNKQKHIMHSIQEMPYSKVHPPTIHNVLYCIAVWGVHVLKRTCMNHDD